MAEVLVPDELDPNMSMAVIKTLNGKQLFFAFDPQYTSIGHFIDSVNENYECQNLAEGEKPSIFLNNEPIQQSNHPMNTICKERTTHFNLRIGNYKEPTKNRYITHQRATEIKHDIESKLDHMTLFVKDSCGNVRSIETPINAITAEFMVLYLIKDGKVDNMTDEISDSIIQCRFIFAGKQLDWDAPLSKYKITHNSTIHSLLRLKGGMFHETSGRMGDYSELNSIIILVSSDITP